MSNWLRLVNVPRARTSTLDQAITAPPLTMRVALGSYEADRAREGLRGCGTEWRARSARGRCGGAAARASLVIDSILALRF